MSEEKLRVKFSVYVIPRRENKVLLSLRKNTGYMDGMYSFVSGHVEPSETAEDAMIRETKEEANVVLSNDQLKYVFTMHRFENDSNGDYISIFFECTDWQGEFVNNEPEKCAGLDWFGVDELPENTIPYIAEVLKLYPTGQRFISRRGTET